MLKHSQGKLDGLQSKWDAHDGHDHPQRCEAESHKQCPSCRASDACQQLSFQLTGVFHTHAAGKMQKSI